ncbi:type III secretion system outer membrane ring subunit SctC [Acerihabitans arboris]|uniref:EscC/YscC/HrcC family type III secretion system outer membrane ring protein n=1 Tax=Acerihabitans arboris TaxID=2691583 RepID=A0A845SK52_9GAMM|nr:type III secretion system outer membrane ring subunit SctC [Acerihabitans arboris]NDL63376.1 EscC/YscC/HrcC family type III secretion system outer membrane ring protein [Acerihabitans arboris]
MLLCAGVPTARAATPEEWKDGAYAYSADNTPLQGILRDFAGSHGVDINAVHLAQTPVSGRLRADNAEAFLNRLALEYRLQWFVYNNTLYVSPQSEQVSRRLKIGQDTADLKQALEGVGLLESRFGWGELPDDGAVLVTGPRQYVDLIADFSKKSEPEPAEDTNKMMMAFPLRYADVADRTIKYRDQTLVVPGVASILNELLGQQGGVGGGQDNQGGQNAMAGEAQAQSKGIMDQMLRRYTRQGSAATAGPTGDRLAGKVSADVRNNILLVRDDKKLRADYQSLVSSIDVPQKLVEIDAIIVDIDRSQLARLSSNWSGQAGNVTGGASMLTGNSTLFVTDFQRFFADIQALEGEGTAAIIANPSVLTLENQPAVIDFSDTAFIKAVGERVADIQSVTAGTSLRVTPRSIAGAATRPAIQLMVDVEDGKLNTDENNTATGTQNGVISTQALVQESRSLVMGGFHTKHSGDDERRVPILGRIPFIGKLFSANNRTISQRERLFIITPHLVGDQVDPSRYVDAENRNQVSDTLRDIGRRHQSGDTKRLIESAMRDLVENRVPAGMETNASGPALSSLCAIPLTFRSGNRHQWYHNNSLRLTAGVITNTGRQTARFDEASCRGARTLAVAAWPHSELAPGESTEVYVAWDDGIPSSPARASLLSATDAGGRQLPSPR